VKSPPVVRIRHLFHRFGTVQALRDLSFDVERGEIVGLFGEPGAGKSTALRAVATLLEPSGGRIEVAGFDTAVEPERVRHRLGYCAFGTGSYGELTVEEYLSFFAAANRLYQRETTEAVLAVANLAASRQQRMSKLADGVLQRVHLARALLHDPELLILDEPGTALDAPSKAELFAVLGALHANGKTLLMASRALANLTGFCTSVLELRSGQLAPAGSRRAFPPTANTLGARLWHFRILGSADAAASVVGALPHVGRVETAGHSLTLAIDGGDGSVAEVVRRLVEAGIGITGVAPKADETNPATSDARETGA